MKSKIRVASISDIHLGHRSTPTRHILENLDKAFGDDEKTGQLDLILFGGDQFDRLLMADDPDLELAKAWWNRFLRIMSKRKVAVRVMRGTPGHDWRQNWLLAVEAAHAKIDVDVKFVDKLSIEYIQSLGIHVLYVPDEWRDNDPVATWIDVQQALAQSNLTQVDFSVVHGFFPHQLPAHVTVPRHNAEQYMAISKGYVLGAHVHKPSVYGENLLVNGSFDRLTHGEEEQKGHWRIDYDPNDPSSRKAEFVINHNARIYVTVDCTGLPVDDAVATIRAQARDLLPGANIRIQASKDDPIAQALEQMRRDYPTYQWSAKVNKDITAQTRLLVDLRSTFTQQTIDPNNILLLMRKRLEAKGEQPERIERLLARLQEFV